MTRKNLIHEAQSFTGRVFTPKKPFHRNTIRIIGGLRSLASGLDQRAVEYPEPRSTALPALGPGIQESLQNRTKVCRVAGYQGQLVNLSSGREKRIHGFDGPPRLLAHGHQPAAGGG